MDDSNAANCFDGAIPTLSNPLTAMVGVQVIPAGLYTGLAAADTVRQTTGRDSDNNIIVYWSGKEGMTPADRAACWLFASRMNQWSKR